MFVYPLVRQKYGNALSGYGAAIFGARWNSKGIQMIYTAENRSLAMAEVAVHLSLATMPNDYFMHTIFVPDSISLLEMTKVDLPIDWNSFPHIRATQKIGDEFIIKNEFCVLKVPSVVTKGDFNILINPFHQEFDKIKVEEIAPFKFDDRLFK